MWEANRWERVQESQAVCYDKTIKHGCYGHSVHEGRVHHDARPCVPYEVQLPVDIADVISCGLNGPVKCNNVVVLILEDYVTGAVARPPPVLIAIGAVEHPAIRSAWVGADQVCHGERALADDRATKAAVWCPLELCDAVLLVGANGPPERRDAHTLRIILGREAVQYPVAAEELTLARILRGPGEHLIA